MQIDELVAQAPGDRRRTTRSAASSCAATRTLAYGRIMEVMGTITQGGFTKVALLAEQPAAAPAGANRRPPPVRPPPASRDVRGAAGAAPAGATG